MGLFSRLFGGNKSDKAKVEVEPIEYKGFLIYQEAIEESGQYRIAGRIEKEIDGELKTHRFIRSDVLSSRSDADEFMLKKAQMFIDQMNEQIFD
ncbi:transcriptional regulator [Vibrio panuliri]|uniref:Transcriptional regulator n=1 Tax=Vibrio panuliri TaxID=1381081 RepID=A0A1Q9H9Y6_9VIBR|nr:HlyU family transcriptional regulator [Vibrio panuliri]OLQ85868.1 transcriptional regulator [Vibrio panuliri]